MANITVNGIKHKVINKTINYQKMQKIDFIHTLGTVYTNGKIFGYVANGYSWLKFRLKDLKK